MYKLKINKYIFVDNSSKFFIYFAIAINFIAHSIQAQKNTPDQDLVSLADEMYKFGDKKDALAVYLQAIEINPNNINANVMAGRCYLETINKELSVNYLLKAYELNKNVIPDILYRIGQGYHLGSRFDDAIKYYTLYKESLTDDKTSKIGSNVMNEVIRADRKIVECKVGKELFANRQNYIIENIKDVVNSEFPDYVPSITSDQSTLIFTSRRAGGVGKNKDVDNEFFEDIWISKKNTSGEWGRPVNVGPPINTISHDANVGISPDGKRIFIYKPDNGGDLFECDIKPDGKWSQPKSLGSNINSKFKELSVSISAEGQTLYFSSDREGGFGGVDIYRCKLNKNGDWGPAENLGSSINTEYDEDAPFIDSDGKTLYFSSRGHKGMGGYDIYRVVWDQTRRTWLTPENMGYPLNSPDDDIYFVLAGDKKTGYYASAKGDGFGDKDIYKIYLKADENDFSMLKKETEAKEAKKQQEYVALPTLSLNSKKKRTELLTTSTSENLVQNNNTPNQEINLPVATKSTTSKDGGDNTLSEKASLPNSKLINTTTIDAEKLAKEKAKTDSIKSITDKINAEKLAVQKVKTDSMKISNDEANARKIAAQKVKTDSIKSVQDKNASEKLIASQNERIEAAKTASEKLEAQKAKNEAIKAEESRVATEKMQLDKERLETLRIDNERIAAEKLVAAEAAKITMNERIAFEKERKETARLEYLAKAKENAELAKIALAKKMAVKPTIIKGNVYDQQSTDSQIATVVISDMKGNKIAEIETDAQGNFQTEVSIKLPTKYSITVNKQGYIYQNNIITVSPSSKTNRPFVKDFALKQVGVGQVFILRNIYYEFDKSNIKKESFQYLDKLASWLQENATIHIEIGGHTDIKGMENYNKILSQNRVNAVMLYLTAKGIAGERLSAIGYGSERPIASNDDENEGREINRRTEFRIVK